VRGTSPAGRQSTRLTTSTFRLGGATVFAWVSRTYLIGFLPEVSLPALLCEAGRRGAYLDMVTPGALPDGYAADNGGALLWLGGRRRRGERTARRTGVSRDASGGRTVETPLAVRFLG